MNIVIFGGSFDPVHAEHIALAQAAKRQLAADKIVVVPAFVPPHKREKNMAPAEDRLAMAKLAFAGVEGAEVSAYEISAGGKPGAAVPDYAQPEPAQQRNKVVNINATTQLQVVLVKPERFDDASTIADQLNAKRTVVLNL